MSGLTYIFVHGAGGWGSYGRIDRVIPYWGMLGGSLMKRLRDDDYDCCAASVAPSGSIWVRACELYAQLAGARVDYGRAYSAENGSISTLPHVYYFAVPCRSTELQPDGTQRPALSKTEIIYYARGVQIGAYKGVTPGGFVIDESWRANDGLVSTVSAMAPAHQPSPAVFRVPTRYIYAPSFAAHQKSR